MCHSIELMLHDLIKQEDGNNTLDQKYEIITFVIYFLLLMIYYSPHLVVSQWYQQGQSGLQLQNCVYVGACVSNLNFYSVLNMKWTIELMKIDADVGKRNNGKSKKIRFKVSNETVWQ